MSILEKLIYRKRGGAEKDRRDFHIGRAAWLIAIAHLIAWIPLAWLIFDWLTGQLSANPIQDATQRMGRAAILMLMASLAVTPVQLITGLRQVQPLARPFGLYAFFYALIHLGLYVGIDYGFDFALILPDAANKPYIYIGLAAFLVLLVLAITSFRWWMTFLGRRWKPLHRWVYLAGVLVIVHYALAVKGDFIHLRGNIGGPLLCAGLLLSFLAIRHPLVRKRVMKMRRHG
jgi:methionine sulfoxide reductase heme-binding subunit